MTLRWHCDHCLGTMHAGFASPIECAEHEETCEYNPARRTCVTCRHLDLNDAPGRKRPKCRAFGDRTYRFNCILWEPKT